jgi:hypothetical protein
LPAADGIEFACQKRPELRVELMDGEQGSQALPAMAREDGDQAKDGDKDEEAELEVRASAEEVVEGPEVLRDGHDGEEQEGH